MMESHNVLVAVAARKFIVIRVTCDSQTADDVLEL